MVLDEVTKRRDAMATRTRSFGLVSSVAGARPTLRLVWRRRSRSACGARRKGSTGEASASVVTEERASSSWEEWKVLAGAGDDDDEVAVAERLNAISNRALRAMLQENDVETVELMFELEQRVEEWQEKGWREESAFLSLLNSMLNHEYDERIVAAFESDEYRNAAKRIYSLIEDRYDADTSPPLSLSSPTFLSPRADFRTGAHLAMACFVSSTRCDPWPFAGCVLTTQAVGK